MRIGTEARHSCRSWLVTSHSSNTTEQDPSSLKYLQSWCGSKGWSVPQESYFYYRWSEKTQFPIGDSLLFEYDNEVNDVLEISGDLEFISCYPISPVAVHMTGHDLVTLTEPGVHYFISSKTPGHCYAGLKLRVVVGPLTKAVPVPNVPTKKIELSLMDRFNRWLRTFGPQPHH